MWKCRECGRTFHLTARISIEKAPYEITFAQRRVVVEKPCCPYCESIEFEEVKEGI